MSGRGAVTKRKLGLSTTSRFYRGRDPSLENSAKQGRVGGSFPHFWCKCPPRWPTILVGTTDNRSGVKSARGCRAKGGGVDVVKVDTQMLRHQVAKLGETIGHLETHETTVGQVIQSFGEALKGETGKAVSVALASYQKAMAALRTEQHGITEKLQSAVAAYDSTDANAAVGLTQAMHL